MNKLTLIFAVAALMIAATSQALMVPGGIRNEIACREAHTIMDYSLTVTLSANADHSKQFARLQTMSMGHALIDETYTVNSLGLNGVVNYLDAQTSGDNFKLEMQGAPLVGQDSTATLSARTAQGSINTDLICSRLLINF